MAADNPRLVLLARLSEALLWDEAVRRNETDPWAYLRRKLEATSTPLREYKTQLLNDAKKRLLSDLGRATLPPGALDSHKEAIEQLIAAGDYADLSFHLDSDAPPASRREGAAGVLDAAKAPTLFDHEAPPPEKRSRAWEKRVVEMSGRLGLERLDLVAGHGPFDLAKRALVARRLRRNLSEYLSVALKEGPIRDELTPFMLARIEAAVAACLRLMNRWR